MMSNRRRVIFAAGFLAMAAAAHAQKAANWRSFKVADGLADSVMLSVTESPRGRIWVKHPAGESISWLDGYDTGILPSPGPGNYRIYESPGGQLWSLTSDGLQLFKDNHWTTFPLAAAGNLAATQPLSLHPVKQNRVLFLTADGLFEFNAESLNQPQIVLARAARQTGLQGFTSLAAARDGGLWIGGSNGLARLPAPLRNLRPDTEWQEHLLDANLGIRNLRELMEDDAGGITALAESVADARPVVAHFDGQQWSIVLASPPDRTLRAWRGLENVWWALTSQALFQWESGQTNAIATEEISARRYFDAAVEPNGVFWLATSDGLFRHAPLAWRTPPNAPPRESVVRGILEDRQERLWIASANSLDVLETNQWRHYALPESASADFRAGRGIFALTNGSLVIELSARLSLFNPRTGQFAAVVHRPESRVRAIGQLRDGSLCVQSFNSGSAAESYRLELFDGAGFRAFPQPLPDANPGADLLLLPGSQSGSFWLAGQRGLAWFHDNKWQSFAPADSTVAEAPTCMLEIGEGRLWCGIRDRIWEFNGKAWWLVRSGFDRVNALARGRDGSVWAATDSGVHRFAHDCWAVNGADEGLPSINVRDICEDHAGRIWAAATYGLSLYHAEADPDPPKTKIHDLPEPRNSVPEGSVINVLFSGRDKWKYTPTARLLFSYRLDQGNWSPMQEDRSVVLPDLRPGKHYFQVRCLDRNWNLDPDPPKLEFAIALPWYKESRPLAIACAGLAVAFFFAAVAFNRHRRLIRSYAEVEAKVALRTSQLEVASRELLHSQKMNALGTLSAGIAHDFNNILSIIKGSAQIIEDNLENPDKVRTRTGRIKTVVEQGAGIVNAMLGFSRQTGQELALCDVNAIVNETIKLLGDRFVRELEVRFEPGQALPEVPASKDFIQQILLNFIFNAADAMNGRGRVVLATRESRQLPAVMALTPAVSGAYVFVSIQDFGSGIAPEIMERIFEPFFTTKSLSTRRGTGLGLSMAYELARQMDCGLAVESVVSQGSTFSLIIPVRALPDNSPKTDK
jgi:signal transduction histidine kinase/ligand-binding sensor domain-containing protein